MPLRLPGQQGSALGLEAAGISRSRLNLAEMQAAVSAGAPNAAAAAVGNICAIGVGAAVSAVGGARRAHYAGLHAAAASTAQRSVDTTLSRSTGGGGGNGGNANNGSFGWYGASVASGASGNSVVGAGFASSRHNSVQLCYGLQQQQQQQQRLHLLQRQQERHRRQRQLLDQRRREERRRSGVPMMCAGDGSGVAIAGGGGEEQGSTTQVFMVVGGDRRTRSAIDLRIR